MNITPYDLLYVLGCLNVLMCEGKIDGPIHTLTSSGKEEFNIMRKNGVSVSDEKVGIVLYGLGCPDELFEDMMLLIREYENRRVC